MESVDRCHGHCPLGLSDATGLQRTPSPAPRLEEREATVLGELAREGDGHVSFQGLRRRLGLHQQVLTRTLRRLERDGLVARDARGYQMTEAGLAATSRVPHDEPHGPSLTVVQALLPSDADAEAVAARLARRWFSGLRWYGESSGPGETTLTWIVEPDGARVRVRIAAGALTVEVELLPGAAEPAFAPLRALLGAIAGLYGPSSGESSFAAS